MARALVKRCDCGADRWSKCSHGWHVRKQIDGQRSKISIDELLGHTDVRLVSQAEPIRDAIVQALRDKPSGTPALIWLRAHPALAPFRRTAAAAPAMPTTVGGWSFATVCARYLAAQVDDPDRRPKYLANLRSSIAQLTGPLGQLPVGQVNDDVLDAFLRDLARGGKSVSTRNKYLDLLRRLGRWTVRKGYRSTPWLVPGDTDQKRRKTLRRQRRLQLGEESRLLAAAGPLLQALIVAGIDTGARLGELLRVRWADVDLTRGRLTLTDLKDQTRRRTLTMSVRLGTVLQMRQTAPDGRLHPPDAFVFGNEVGERIGSVHNSWMVAVLKAHGEPVVRVPQAHTLAPASLAAYHRIDLVFSDLRHEATSRWLDGGTSLHQVREWLGHTSFEMLATYGHSTPEESDRAMRAFEAAQAEMDRAAGKVAQSGPTTANLGEQRKVKNPRKPLTH